MTTRRSKLKPVKWAHLHEIKRTLKVGTPEWRKAHPERRVRKLSAWRRLHMFGGHPPVRKLARFKGRDPSSKLTLPQMLVGVRKLEKP